MAKKKKSFQRRPAQARPFTCSVCQRYYNSPSNYGQMEQTECHRHRDSARDGSLWIFYEN